MILLTEMPLSFQNYSFQKEKELKNFYRKFWNPSKIEIKNF